MSGIAVEGVRKSFAATRVLHGVTLDMPAGEFVSLVGPSGCGKTTLLRIIAGLERQDAGRVRIAGHDVSTLRAADRDIAMVFQNYALYPHMTARQNMALPLAMRQLSALQRVPFIGVLVPGTRATRRAIQDEVTAAADLLAIGHLLDRRPAQLSGGQRQRVALGRAIVRHPRAFLMDEPLSNLDAALRHETRKELVELHRRVGVTTVYVTHDQAEAMTMSDRVAVMLGGHVLQFDTPQAVYDRPADLRVAGFIGAPRINVLDADADAAGRVAIGGWMLGVAAPGHAGARLSVGLRPEHLRPAATGLMLDVRHVEFLGADILAYGRHEAAAADVIVRLSPEAWQAVPDRTRLVVQPAPGRALLFGADGARIAARADAAAVVHAG
jgi:multiple sugar transport system ATP-binding protein